MWIRACFVACAVGLLACGADPVVPPPGDGPVVENEQEGGVDGGEPSNGDRCETAIAATAGTFRGTTVGAKGDYDADCTGFDNPGDDVVYRVVVPPGQRLVAGVTTEGAGAGEVRFDPSLYLLAATSSTCAARPPSCLAAADQSKTDAERVEWLNTTASEAAVFVVVDSYRAGQAHAGAFVLELSLQTPQPGDTCASPVALTPGSALTGLSFSGFTNDYQAAPTCAGSAGADRTFGVAVPSGQLLRLTVTPSAELDVTVSASTSAAACGKQCVAAVNDVAAGRAETLTWKNTGSAAASVFVSVDSGGTSAGTFSILAELSTPPADDVCEGATVLASGVPLTSQTTVGYGNDYSLQAGYVGCASTGYSGPDRAYLVTIPPMQRGTVTVTPSPGAFNPSLNLLETELAVCSSTPRVCSTGINLGGAGQPESVSIYNTGTDARSYWAVVDNNTAQGGAFDISYVTNTPPADDTCTTATTWLGPGGVSTASLNGFVQDYGSVGAGCFAFRGPDRVYRAMLGPGQKLTARVAPIRDGGLDPVVSFIPGGAAACETLPRKCAGGIDFTLRNEAEVGGYVNDTMAPQELFMVVADYETDSTDTSFELSTTLGPPPLGETCMLSMPVAASQTLSDESLVGASADVHLGAGAGCINTNALPDRVYEVTVPAGQTLTAVATPAAGVNLAMNLISGVCRDVAACLASANTGGAGAAETLTWTNTSASTRTAQLVVVGVPPRTFSLQVSVQ